MNDSDSRIMTMKHL